MDPISGMLLPSELGWAGPALRVSSASGPVLERKDSAETAFFEVQGTNGTFLRQQPGFRALRGGGEVGNGSPFPVTPPITSLTGNRISQPSPPRSLRAPSFRAEFGEGLLVSFTSPTRHKAKDGARLFGGAFQHSSDAFI